MFTPRDPAHACGMYSLTYFIAISIVTILIIIALKFTKKANEKTVKKILLGIAIFTISTEIIKIIFIGTTYGLESVEFLPLYFCSLFMPTTVFAILPNKHLRTCGLSFIFFGGIIGALAFFLYPNACIPNYPIYHFMCLRTLLYHGSMIYAGILVVITGYYQPNVKHFKHYLIMLLIVCFLAYTINKIKDMDLMYINRPLNIEAVIKIYNTIPNLYPFIVMILEIIVPFWTSYYFYKLITKIRKRRKKTWDQLNTLYG